MWLSAEPTGTPITTVTERLAYRNDFVSVYDDEVVFSDGRSGSHLRIVEGAGHRGVAALAVSGGAIALVRTYRYPLGSWEWAIPRGFAERGEPGEEIRRELSEELGGLPERLEHLIDLTPNSGLLSGTVSVFLATYRAPVTDPTDTAEVHEVRWIPSAEVRDLVLTGRIIDGFTIAALGAAAMRGLVTFPVA